MSIFTNIFKGKNSQVETNLQQKNQKSGHMLQPNDMTMNQVYQKAISRISTQNYENQKKQVSQMLSKFMDLNINIQQLQLFNNSGHEQQKKLHEKIVNIDQQLVRSFQNQIKRLKQQCTLTNEQYNELAQKHRNSQFSLSMKAYEILKQENQAKRMRNKFSQLLKQKEQQLKNINQVNIRCKEQMGRQIVRLTEQNKVKQAELHKTKDQLAKTQSKLDKLNYHFNQSQIMSNNIQQQKQQLLNFIKQIVKSTELQNTNKNLNNKPFQKDQPSFHQFYSQIYKIQQNFTKLKQSLKQKQQEIIKTNQIYNQIKAEINNSLDDINNKNNVNVNQIDQIIGLSNKMFNKINVILFKEQRQNSSYISKQFKLMNQQSHNFIKNQIEFIKKQNIKNIELIESNQKLNKEIRNLNTTILSIEKKNQQQIDKLNAQIMQLNLQIKGLKQKIKQLEIQLAQKQTQIQSLKEQIVKLKNILGTKSSQIQKLKKQKEIAQIKYNKSISQLKQTNQTKINQLNLHYQQQIRKLNKKNKQQIQKLQQILKNGNNQSGRMISKLNEEKRKLTQQLLATNNQYQKKVTDQQKEIKKLRESITPFLCESAVLDCCREDQKQHILWIKQQIQSFVGTRIVSSRTLFRKAKTNFHHYVDNIPNLLLVVKLQVEDRTARVAAFTTNGFYKKAGLQRGNGILLSLQTKKSYKLKQQPDAKALSYDQYNLKWGNDQIRIGLNNSIMFSNFGVSMGYYNPDGDKLSTFIGPSKKQQFEIISYQLLQIRFEKEQFVNKYWANQAQIIEEGRFS